MSPDRSKHGPADRTGVLPQVSLPATLIPERLKDIQRERLRGLLGQNDHWVRRDHWEEYLDGDDVGEIPLDQMGKDDKVAAVAWMRQQRHELHRALEGERPAPDGWLEKQPLYEALTRE